MARIASPMTDIRDLIVAAGASDSDLEDVVRQIGVERVADMLVYELVDRADLSELGDTADVTVQFELRAGDRRVARAVRARGGTAACEAGTAASPDATVVQDLVDLARAVFGPRPERANATRSIVWRDPGAAGTPSRSRWANEAPQVTHRLLRGSATSGARWSTASTWWAGTSCWSSASAPCGGAGWTLGSCRARSRRPARWIS